MNFFSEEERKLTAAQKRAAANKIIKDLQKQGKKAEKDKTKSAYTEYLQKQLDFKRKKYEEQKKKQLENIRKKGVEQHKEKAKQALSGIKTERIGEKDTDSGALMKAGSNVGSLAGGIAKSAIHGVRYLAAKKRAEKEAEQVKKKQLEKKEMGKPGRRKKQQEAVNEIFSCWREELVIEVENKDGKKEEKKIVDVMKGKNKIEINPNISEDHKEIATGKRKDDEGYMAKVELDSMERAISTLRKKIKKSDMQLPAWVQSKITRAADYIDSATEYLQSDEKLSEEKVDKSKMKCNKPKAQAHGSGETGKSHIVKACEGGKEKIIRFGQLGVKGSPKKEGESDEYASRRNRFKSRHAKNIAKGKMSAAYWADKVKW